MESLTLVLVSDPSKTRTVSPNSWKHWSKVKGLDPNEFRGGAGTEVWRLVDAEFLAAQRDVKAAPRKPIQMPEEIRRVVAKPVEEAPVEVAPPADIVVEAVVSEAQADANFKKVEKAALKAKTK